MLGLSLSLTRAGVAVWSPHRLYAAGEQGAWYLNDPSTMFQDAAGTTPVTAVGQPVGLWKDKSGRGNHASQSTTTARPTLQQDSGGRYYLQGDGVDDLLGTSVQTAASGLIAVSVSADSLGYMTVVSSGGNTATLAGAGIKLRSDGAIWMVRCDGSVSTYNQTSSGVASAGVPLVASFDYSASSAAARVNGTVRASSAVARSAQSARTFNLFAGEGPPEYTKGRIYGAVILGRAASQGEIAKVERYLAIRSGVPLP